MITFNSGYIAAILFASVETCLENGVWCSVSGCFWFCLTFVNILPDGDPESLPVHKSTTYNAGAIVGLCLGVVLIVIVVVAVVAGFKGYLSSPSTYYMKYVSFTSVAGIFHIAFTYLTCQPSTFMNDLDLCLDVKQVCDNLELLKWSFGNI